MVGRGIIGVPISEVLTATPASSLAFWRRRGRTSAVTGLDSLLPHLIKAFSNEKYILWAEARHSTHNVQVFLKDGHTALDHLKAWIHAADFVSLCPLNASSLPELMHHLEESKKTVDRHFQTFVGGLKEAGWDIDAPGLVSGSPITIQIEEVVGNGGEDKKNV